MSRATETINETKTRELTVPHGVLEFEKTIAEYINRTGQNPVFVIVGSKTYQDIVKHIQQLILADASDTSANGFMRYCNYTLVVDPERLYRVAPTSYPPVTDDTND